METNSTGAMFCEILWQSFVLWSFVFPRGAPSRLGMHQLWADTVHPSVFFCFSSTEENGFDPGSLYCELG